MIKVLVSVDPHEAVNAPKVYVLYDVPLTATLIPPISVAGKSPEL